MPRLLQKKFKEVMSSIDNQLSNPQAPPMTAGYPSSVQFHQVPPGFYPVVAAHPPPYQNSYYYMYQPYPPAAYITAPTSHPGSPGHVYSYMQHTQTPPAAAVEAAALSCPSPQPPACPPAPAQWICSQTCDPAGDTPGSGLQVEAAAAARDENELLSISSGVQLFFVEPQGEVSSLSSPGYLRIIVFDSDLSDSTAQNSAVFLDVCDLLYPLTVDTPVLLAHTGIFMFPDSEVPGSSVGIVLSSQLPSAERELFQDLLSQLANLRVQNPVSHEGEITNFCSKVSLAHLNENPGQTVRNEKAQLPKWSVKTGRGISSGAAQISHSLAKGARSTSKFIHKRGAKVREHITPQDTPLDVSPHVTQSLNAAKKASGSALQASRFLDDGMTSISEQAAKKVAPKVKKQGSRPDSTSLPNQGDSTSNLKGAKFVASNSFEGVSSIWSSLITGAKDVYKSVADETTSTVEYKYGEEAGQATELALQSVENVGLTAYNVNKLGVNTFLLRTAKNTARELVESKDEQST